MSVRAKIKARLDREWEAETEAIRRRAEERQALKREYEAELRRVDEKFADLLEETTP